VAVAEERPDIGGKGWRARRHHGSPQNQRERAPSKAALMSEPVVRNRGFSSNAAAQLIEEGLVRRLALLGITSRSRPFAELVTRSTRETPCSRSSSCSKAE